MRSILNRLKKLENLCKKDGGNNNDEEWIMHVVFVSSPNSDPSETWPGKKEHYPPVEEQIAAERARGQKRFIVFSDGADDVPEAKKVMTGREFSDICKKLDSMI